MAGFCDLNQKNPLIQAILIFVCNLNFMLSLDEYERNFESSGQI